MKKLRNRLTSVSLLCLLLAGTAWQKASAQDVSVSYQTFYDDLSPYGQWVSDQQYGNVWVPNENSDFRPYGTGGHWVMTDYGNTWVSDDPWGWACYHYGRWTYDPYYGWVWIPGYEWAPAWVSWRFGGGTCGWAPLGPGASIGGAYNCPDNWWVFVAPQYMYQPNCIHYWRGPSYNRGYIRQAPFINNVYADNGTHVRYNYGPRADAIQQVTHQPVQVYHVSQGSRPGAPSINGNKVSLYRPSVNRATVSTARPANVIAAPRQIGKPQAATNAGATKQSPFRQQVQKGAVNTGNNGARPGNAANVQHGNPQPANNGHPGRQQPAGNQPQPNRQPQAVHNNQQQPNRQPQPQHNNQQQTNRQPQPQHNQPQINRQPQQQRSQPMPQQHMQQSMPQQHMEQPRQQPMPQQHMEAPHQAAPPREEGGGRR